MTGRVCLMRFTLGASPNLDCRRAGVELSSRRARHPLHTAFRAIDASSYGEIATIDADGRAVLR